MYLNDKYFIRDESLFVYGLCNTRAYAQTYLFRFQINYTLIIKHGVPLLTIS